MCVSQGRYKVPVAPEQVVAWTSLLCFCRVNYPDITTSSKDPPPFPTGQTDSARGTLQTIGSARGTLQTDYCSPPPQLVRLDLLLEPFKQDTCIIPSPTGQSGSAQGTLQTDYCLPLPQLVRLVLLLEPFKQAMCIIPFPTGQIGSARGTLQTDHWFCSWNPSNRLLLTPSTVVQTGSTLGTLQIGHVYYPFPDRPEWFCPRNPSYRLLFTPSTVGQTGSARGTLQTDYWFCSWNPSNRLCVWSLPWPSNAARTNIGTCRVTATLKDTVCHITKSNL
jgi:hypothetical protein